MINDKYLLTAIVPVSAMANKLQNFKLWVDYSPAELKIIVVHDWRDSDTGDELKKIIEGKVNIELIEGKFGSPGAARNAGLAEVNTEWTVFWDSDDLPNVKKCLEILGNTTHSVNLIVNSFDVKSLVSNQTIRISYPPNGSLSSQLNYMAHDPGIWRIIFRSELINTIRFSDLKMGEDVLFLAQVIDKDGDIFFNNSVVYTYFRDVPGQLTGNDDHIPDIKKLIRLLGVEFANDFKVKNFLLPLLAKQISSLLIRKFNPIKLMFLLLENHSIRRHPILFGLQLIKIIKIFFEQKRRREI